MPLEAIASAVSRTTFSLRPLQPYLFQLFHPIGGVFASPLSSAWQNADATNSSNTTTYLLATESLICITIAFSLMESTPFRRRKNSTFRTAVIRLHIEKLHRSLLYPNLF